MDTQYACQGSTYTVLTLLHRATSGQKLHRAPLLFSTKLFYFITQNTKCILSSLIFQILLSLTKKVILVPVFFIHYNYLNASDTSAPSGKLTHSCPSSSAPPSSNPKEKKQDIQLDSHSTTGMLAMLENMHLSAYEHAHDLCKHTCSQM